MGTGVDEVEVQKGPEERGQHFGEEREEERMNFGVVREEGEIFGSKTGYFGRGREKCGKRVRKGVSPFSVLGWPKYTERKGCRAILQEEIFLCIEKESEKIRSTC